MDVYVLYATYERMICPRDSTSSRESITSRAAINRCRAQRVFRVVCASIEDPYARGTPQSCDPAYHKGIMYAAGHNERSDLAAEGQLPRASLSPSSIFSSIFLRVCIYACACYTTAPTPFHVYPLFSSALKSLNYMALLLASCVLLRNIMFFRTPINYVAFSSW